MGTVYHYSARRVQELRDLARQRKLSAPPGFYAAPLEQLVQCYNGIGPEQWSSCLRRLITWLLSFFEVDALIHDYEYSLPDKSYWRFTVANWRFVYNSVRNVFYCVNFTRCRALKVAGLGVLLGVLCQLFGFAGYRAGKLPGREDI